MEGCSSRSAEASSTISGTNVAAANDTATRTATTMKLGLPGETPERRRCATWGSLPTLGVLTARSDGYLRRRAVGPREDHRQLGEGNGRDPSFGAPRARPPAPGPAERAHPGGGGVHL